MITQILYDQKWIKFLRRIWLFRFIPFVDFALAAGSMAMGNVRPESDFDVIIGARSGRIFTARFFAVLFFGIFGWRRKKWHGESGIRYQVSGIKDKICLNHFVTEKSYRLSPPYNEYWEKLYQNLVPIYGEKRQIHQFWQANNDWMSMQDARSPKPEARSFHDDLRYIYRKPSLAKNVAEWLLGGRLGDFWESFLRRLQLAKIKSSLKSIGYKPRITYTDDELEFHPDTRRIEDYIQH